MGRCLCGIHNRLADSLTTTTLEQSACDKYRKHLVRRSGAQLGQSAQGEEREESQEKKKKKRSDWLGKIVRQRPGEESKRGKKTPA